MTDTKRKNRLAVLLLIFAMVMMLAACGGKDPGEEPAEGQGDEPSEPALGIVTVIDEIDTEDMADIPLQIESITLYDDGTVAIVPTDDLLKNAETNDELRDGAMHPFDDSGKVKEVFLVRFGNGGYRTVICLMEDGTLSALSGIELIEDHIAVVWDNLTGRDTYTSVREVLSEDGDAYNVIGITEDGEEVELDFALNF